MRGPLLVLAVAVVAGCGVKAPPRPPTFANPTANQAANQAANPASSGTTPGTTSGTAPGDVPAAPKDSAPMPSSNASPGSNPR